MRNLINRKERGFTLIELLVVIAIIGILAAVVLVSLNSARAKSRDARRIADIRQIMTALELFYNDNGGYPAAVSNQPSGGNPAWSTYLNTWPTAPVPADGSCTSPGTNDYVYNSPGANAASYTLVFCLGGKTGTYSGGVHTASQTGITP